MVEAAVLTYVYLIFPSHFLYLLAYAARGVVVDLELASQSGYQNVVQAMCGPVCIVNHADSLFYEQDFEKVAMTPR